MINHLKEIYRKTYLPIAPPPPLPSFKVTLIDDPFLYTDANIYVDTFDNPNQSIKVEVSNVGGGRLYVEHIRIPRGFERWVKRADGSKPVTLTSTSEPLELELKLNLRTLPNPSSKNRVKLSVLSNSKRKTFSDILLCVNPPDTQRTNLMLPEYINFGEITTCKVSIADKREDMEAPSAEFLLIGDFRLYPPTRLEITQKDESTFDAYIFTSKSELHYTLDLRKPSVVMPRQKKTGIALKYFKQHVSIPIVSQSEFSEQVITSDSDWLVVQSKIYTTGYDTIELPVSVNVEKLEAGRNVGELSLADKKTSIWVWHKIVNETTLMLDKEQPDLHHVETFSEQEKPLPIDVFPEDDPYQFVMIFGDVDFQFPRTGEERLGYLMGSFNDWTPRTLFFEKRNDAFGVPLSLFEGTYVYRAEIDGEMRLDPARLYEIICCSHGIASRIQIEKIEQKVTLRNRSKQKLELTLRSATDWLRIKPETLVLPGRKKHEVTAIIRPKHLLPGLNLGWIQVETEKEPKRTFQSPIYVFGRVNGPVPVVRNDELVFPQMEQNASESVPIELDILGAGRLKGEIQPSTFLRFSESDLDVQNETAFELMPTSPLVQVVSERPANAYRKQIRASLITDCYLANRRVLPFVAKYDMVHLVANPPALYFPKIYLFDDPQHVTITIKRSDNKGNVVCSVKIPDELSESGFLETIDNLAADNTGHCKLIINPQVHANTGRVSAIIRFHDDKSGMLLPIQFAADIVEGKAKIEVNSHKQRFNGIPLTITNIGKTELRVFEVRFKRQRFHIFPQFTSQQRTLHTGESVERIIQPNKTLNFLGGKIKDTLVIRLNDPQYPNGVFEKEIVVDIRGRFVKFRKYNKK
ncbi:MAG: glycogen-binding domain-containing protein [Candidatus Poribacteria bacterium]|nr:glycogen-binding domain-containing protein [Candidatus Poribacteria bacterium]